MTLAHMNATSIDKFYIKIYIKCHPNMFLIFVLAYCVLICRTSAQSMLQDSVHQWFQNFAELHQPGYGNFFEYGFQKLQSTRLHLQLTQFNNRLLVKFLFSLSCLFWADYTQISKQQHTHVFFWPLLNESFAMTMMCRCTCGTVTKINRSFSQISFYSRRFACDLAMLHWVVEFPCCQFLSFIRFELENSSFFTTL